MHKSIAVLFGVNAPAVSQNFRNIIAAGELEELQLFLKIGNNCTDGKL